MKTQTLKKTSLLSYGILAVPLAFAGLPLYIQAPEFYVTNQGIALTQMGLALLLLRCFDAIQDPLFGWIYDRLPQQQKYLRSLAMVVMIASFYALFHPTTTLSPLLYFCLCLGLCSSAYSFLMVSYLADGARFQIASSQRSRITGTREAMMLIGVLMASSLPSLFANLLGDTWLGISCLLAVLGGLALWIYQHALHAQTLRPNPLQSSLSLAAMIPHQTTEKKLLGTYLISAFASAIPGVLVLFYIRDQLGLYEYYGLFLLIYFLSGAMSMPLWIRLSQHYSKVTTWQWSMLLAMLTFVGASFLGQGDFIPYSLICATSGLALGADLAMPPAIVADYLAATPDANGGLTLGRLSFCNKWGLTLASGISLPLLSYLGYEPNHLQPEGILSPLATGYALIPCFFKGIALFLLWKWRDLFMIEQRSPEMPYESS